MGSHGWHLVLWIRRSETNFCEKLPRFWKINNIFLYSRTSVTTIYIRVSFTHTGGLGASTILRGLDPNKYLGKLISFLDPVLPTASRTDFVRCWHAKTDGWAASTFHSNCDGRGPTVTIIKVNDYIFGGYTDASWSGGRYIKFLRGDKTSSFLLGFKGGGRGCRRKY